MTGLDFVEMSSPAFMKGAIEEEKPFQSPVKPFLAKREDGGAEGLFYFTLKCLPGVSHNVCERKDTHTLPALI